MERPVIDLTADDWEIADFERFHRDQKSPSPSSSLQKTPTQTAEDKRATLDCNPLSGPENTMLTTECCNNQTCNNCVNHCYTQTSGCTKACVRQCIQPDPIKIPLPIPEIKCDETEEPSEIAIVGTTNSTNRVNITTTINLHNIINNTNIINSPVYVNNTNINHVHFPSRSQGKDVTYINTTRLETLNHHHHGCCYVLHPRECFYVQKNQTERQIKCIRRRHKECSPLCTSPVVLIMPVLRPYPLYVPQYLPGSNYQQQQRCHYVQRYPWVYCGNYQKHEPWLFRHILQCQTPSGSLRIQAPMVGGIPWFFLSEFLAM
ncbi:hypothetical protein ILUMI_13591 [Ignelater luminosus]|uniref:Uncharacterized protein n=1 Tax=Ignelater luminosus TaxID=2038154 RepID=A0A8K0GBT8_IGNLU|nr:hypothetical protein ILUMI_13591 [Ignelater luminosus]